MNSVPVRGKEEKLFLFQWHLISEIVKKILKVWPEYTLQNMIMIMANQNTLPGVMQFESNLFSVGRVSPDSLAFLSKASASRADLKIKLYMKYWKISTISFHLYENAYNCQYIKYQERQILHYLYVAALFFLIFSILEVSSVSNLHYKHN